MGLPVQVFPSGPPAPPPVPSKAQLNVSNANRSPSLPRKTNQSLEPPPMGCRPEIKIPPNPMAALRKVPTPKEKNDYWVEEYKKERSKSPMVGQPDSNEQSTPTSSMSNGTETSEQFPQSVQDFNNYSVTKPSVDKVDSPVPSNASSNTFSSGNNNNNNQTKVDSPLTDQNNNFNYPANNSVNNYNYNNNGNNYAFRNSNPNSPQQRINSPFASSPQPNLPKPLSPIKLSPDENLPIYVRSSQRAASEKPQAPQPPMYSLARQSSLEQAQPPIYQRTHRNVTASPVNQFNQQNAQTENVPIYVRSFQKQQAPQPPKSAEPNTQKPMSTAQQSYNSEPGRQYYQPNRVTSPPADESQAPLANQPMPPWMTRRGNTKEIPDWANNVDNFASNNRTTMAPNMNSSQQANLPTNQNNYSMNGNNDYYNANTKNNNNNNGTGKQVQFQ